jgi:hypothetical protein
MYYKDPLYVDVVAKLMIGFRNERVNLHGRIAGFSCDITPASLLFFFI